MCTESCCVGNQEVIVFNVGQVVLVRLPMVGGFPSRNVTCVGKVCPSGSHDAGLFQTLSMLINRAQCLPSPENPVLGLVTGVLIGGLYPHNCGVCFWRTNAGVKKHPHTYTAFVGRQVMLAGLLFHIQW